MDASSKGRNKLKQCQVRLIWYNHYSIISQLGPKDKFFVREESDMPRSNRVLVHISASSTEVVDMLLAAPIMKGYRVRRSVEDLENGLREKYKRITVDREQSVDELADYYKPYTAFDPSAGY